MILFLLVVISCSKSVVQDSIANKSFDDLRIKECVFSKDCPQPECIGAVSICQNNSCTIVGDCVKSFEFSLSCNRDLDCHTTGCSNELCVGKSNVDIITSCDFKPEFDCLRQTYCGCSNNKCSWKETYKYRDCMRSINAS